MVRGAEKNAFAGSDFEGFAGLARGEAEDQMGSAAEAGQGFGRGEGDFEESRPVGDLKCGLAFQLSAVAEPRCQGKRLGGIEDSRAPLDVGLAVEVGAPVDVGDGVIDIAGADAAGTEVS